MASFIIDDMNKSEKRFYYIEFKDQNENASEKHLSPIIFGSEDFEDGKINHILKQSIFYLLNRIFLIAEDPIKFKVHLKLNKFSDVPEDFDGSPLKVCEVPLKNGGKFDVILSFKSVSDPFEMLKDFYNTYSYIKYQYGFKNLGKNWKKSIFKTIDQNVINDDLYGTKENVPGDMIFFFNGPFQWSNGYTKRQMDRFSIYFIKKSEYAIHKFLKWENKTLPWGKLDDDGNIIETSEYSEFSFARNKFEDRILIKKTISWNTF